ncbi:hypothetical protein ZEAMMB73_Zm00001d032970 [Zea mays]|jgi:hypothetical protein|uniref:Uncharacterized protein n=1 Tax=Zea mays TaxID=4577 RepID=B4FX55_MAIZE|nr:unknown [Zea mays]ONM06462.1 hypothetical protein ZEAMMB73_Zm00001d032970 [Zea mays]ONM06469.1 hypothetical protein ZEAMMB73_Zm00001d032970 [Zea mays]
MSKPVCKIIPLLLPQQVSILDDICSQAYQFTTGRLLLARCWLFENLNFQCWNLVNMLIIVIPSPYCIVSLLQKNCADHAIPFPNQMREP